MGCFNAKPHPLPQGLFCCEAPDQAASCRGAALPARCQLRRRDPINLARLDEPLTTLGDLRGTVVIDEVQRRPELFPLLRVPAATLQRFWAMLAHFHGQLWNGSELGRSLGVNQATCRRYLDLLAGVYMVRLLQPWHANLLKRQVKAPKIYFRDTGLLHQLLQIPDQDSLLCHPRLGASWEGFVIDQLLEAWKPDGAWFWATHGGAELDLLVVIGGKRIGIEVKRADAPRLSASMRQALVDLELDQLLVVSPGERGYRLHERAKVVPLAEALARPG